MPFQRAVIHLSKRLNQIDSDAGLSYALFSKVYTATGHTEGFMKIGIGKAHIKQWIAEHVKRAVWMIEEQ